MALNQIILNKKKHDAQLTFSMLGKNFSNVKAHLLVKSINPL